MGLACFFTPDGVVVILELNLNSVCPSKVVSQSSESDDVALENKKSQLSRRRRELSQAKKGKRRRRREKRKESEKKRERKIRFALRYK